MMNEHEHTLVQEQTHGVADQDSCCLSPPLMFGTNYSTANHIAA